MGTVGVMKTAVIFQKEFVYPKVLCYNARILLRSERHELTGRIYYFPLYRQ